MINELTDYFYNGDDFENDSMELEIELALIFEEDVHLAADETIDELYGKANEQIIASRLRLKQFYSDCLSNMEY